PRARLARQARELELFAELRGPCAVELIQSVPGDREPAADDEPGAERSVEDTGGPLLDCLSAALCASHRETNGLHAQHRVNSAAHEVAAAKREALGRSASSLRIDAGGHDTPGRVAEQSGRDDREDDISILVPDERCERAARTGR